MSNTYDLCSDKYTFDYVIRSLIKSKIYKDDNWIGICYDINNIDAECVLTIATLWSFRSPTISIAYKNWPVRFTNPDDLNLIQGDHYFYLTDNTNNKMYYYNVDEGRWHMKPPSEILIFIDKWFKLLNNI